MWCADAPRTVLKEGFLSEAVDLGITTLAVMIDTNLVQWDPRWKVRELEQLCDKAVVQRDLEVVLTVWPVPMVVELAAMRVDLERMVQFGCVAVEIDVEGLWKERWVRGFDDLGHASKHLLDMLLSICQPHEVRTELTTHPFHDEGVWTTAEVEAFLAAEAAMRHRSLAPNVDRILWQAYSTNRTPGGKPVKWNDSKLGPGAMQEFTLGRALNVPGVAKGRPKLGVGLAAYRQAWLDHAPIESMWKAYAAALRYEPVEVRWWDSRFIIGNHRNEYSADFIRRIAAAA